MCLGAGNLLKHARQRATRGRIEKQWHRCTSCISYQNQSVSLHWKKNKEQHWNLFNAKNAFNHLLACSDCLTLPVIDCDRQMVHPVTCQAFFFKKVPAFFEIQFQMMTSQMILCRKWTVASGFCSSVPSKSLLRLPCRWARDEMAGMATVHVPVLLLPPWTKLYRIQGEAWAGVATAGACRDMETCCIYSALAFQQESFGGPPQWKLVEPRRRRCLQWSI